LLVDEQELKIAHMANFFLPDLLNSPLNTTKQTLKKKKEMVSKLENVINP